MIFSENRFRRFADADLRFGIIVRNAFISWRSGWRPVRPSPAPRTGCCATPSPWCRRQGRSPASLSSITLVTLPIRPPPVTTVSPRRTAASMSWCFLSCCWRGRIMKKYITTKIMTNGTTRSKAGPRALNRPPSAQRPASRTSNTPETWKAGARAAPRKLPEYSHPRPQCNCACRPSARFSAVIPRVRGRLRNKRPSRTWPTRRSRH